MTEKGFGRIGVDIGVKTLATLSDLPAVKPYKANKTKLAIMQRKLARQGKKQAKTVKRQNRK